MPDHAWVFTGSRILKEGFEGDIAKSAGGYLARSRRPFRQSPADGRKQRLVNRNPKRLTPKRGTPIEFIIKALPKPAPKPEPNKARRTAEKVTIL